jgi:hypothetical protein
LNQYNKHIIAEDNEKNKKVDDGFFSYTFVHSLSTDFAIVAIIIITIKITGATEKRVLYMCAQKHRKKKTPKWVTAQQKKKTGVKNFTPNKMI